MKNLLIILLFIGSTILSADVLFYENFNRSDGAVGNDWFNVGPAVNSTIENEVMKVEAGFNRGVSRDFDNITAGTYFIQYDWKFSESDWFVNSFPNDVPVQLLWENTGNMYSDNNGTFVNPTLLGNWEADTWVTIRWQVNLDTDSYSLWINNALVADTQIGNSVNSFSKFNFRTTNGSSGIQYVDNFIIYNNTPPSVPTGLSATGNLNNIMLTWDEAENTNFLSYKIYRGTSSPANELLSEVAGTQNEYIDNDVEANTIYYYRITAVSMETIESTYSEEQNAHRMPLPIINPESFTVNLNLDNPSNQFEFNLSNIGAYQLDYSLTGTDSLGSDDLLPGIAGFTPMGIHNGHTYYRSNQTMSWHAAKNLCEEIGGHLATVSDMAENTFIYQNTTGSSWLGLTDEVSEGNWEWITGEAVTFTYWLPGEPNNSNNEDYAHLRLPNTQLDKWNDVYDSYSSYAIAEFDYLFSPSILSFSSGSGSLNSGDNTNLTVTVDASNLADGTYETFIKLTVSDLPEPFYYPVTINIDQTPPEAVLGLAVDSDNTNANQISIIWEPNPVEEQIIGYHVYRRGKNEVDWTMLASLSHQQTSYTDSQFTPIDSTYVFYQIKAEDWVGNIGEASEPLQASLERYIAPENLQIANLDNKDIQITWNQVTHTMTGLPGTPSCYLIYKSQSATPVSDYDFLAVSFTPEYTHQWALYFQPADKLFYIVTAYGGNMNRLNNVLSRKQGWKKSELEDLLKTGK